MARVSNYGMRRINDVASRFYQAAQPTYLRVLTDDAVAAENQEFAQFGFQVAASGNAVTEDVRIEPRPQVNELSLHDIGLNAAQLSFGSKRFLISHTWVLSRQTELNYIDVAGQPDFYRVFSDVSVQGLYYSSRLFKVVSAVPENLGGAPWIWEIITSGPQTPVVA